MESHKKKLSERGQTTLSIWWTYKLRGISNEEHLIYCTIQRGIWQLRSTYIPQMGQDHPCTLLKIWHMRRINHSISLDQIDRLTEKANTRIRHVFFLRTSEHRRGTIECFGIHIEATHLMTEVLWGKRKEKKDYDRIGNDNTDWVDDYLTYWNQLLCTRRHQLFIQYVQQHSSAHSILVHSCCHWPQYQFKS